MPDNPTINPPSNQAPDLSELDGFLSQSRQAVQNAVSLGGGQYHSGAFWLPPENLRSGNPITQLEADLEAYGKQVNQWVNGAEDASKDEDQRIKFLMERPMDALYLKSNLALRNDEATKGANRDWEFTQSELLWALQNKYLQEYEQFKKKLDKYDESQRGTILEGWLGAPARSWNRMSQRMRAEGEITDVGARYLRNLFGDVTVIGGIFDDIELGKAQQRIADGTATPKDIHIVALNNVSEHIKGKRDLFAKARDVAVEAVPFAMSFMVSGPAGAASKKAATIALKKAVSRTARQGIAKTSKRLIGKGLTAGLAKTAGAVPYAAGQLAHPANWGLISRNLSQSLPDRAIAVRYKGDAGRDRFRKEIIAKGKELEEAIPEAAFDAYTELLTENLGFQLGGMAKAGGKAIGKLAPESVKRLARSRIAQTMMSWWVGKGRTPDTLIRRVASHAGFNGVLSEMYEERLGELMRMAGGLEPDGVIPSLMERKWAEAFEQLAVESLGFSAMGGAGIAAETASSALGPTAEQKQQIKQRMSQGAETVVAAHELARTLHDPQTAAEFVGESPESVQAAKEFIKRVKSDNPGVTTPVPSRKAWREMGPGYMANAQQRREMYEWIRERAESIPTYDEFRDQYVNQFKESGQELPEGYENDVRAEYQQMLTQGLQEARENAEGIARQADEGRTEEGIVGGEAEGIRVRDTGQDRREKEEGISEEEIRQAKERLKPNQRPLAEKGPVTSQEAKVAIDMFVKAHGLSEEEAANITFSKYAPEDLREESEFAEQFPEIQLVWFYDKTGKIGTAASTWGRVMLVSAEKARQYKSRGSVIWRIVGDEIAHATGADALESVFPAEKIKQVAQWYYEGKGSEDSPYKEALDKLRESDPKEFDHRMAREATAVLVAEFLSDQNFRDAIRQKDESLFQRIVRAVLEFFRLRKPLEEKLSKEQRAVLDYLRSQQKPESAREERVKAVSEQHDRFFGEEKSTEPKTEKPAEEKPGTAPKEELDETVIDESDEWREAAKEADQGDPTAEDTLDSLARQMGIDPDEYETWREVVDAMIRKEEESESLEKEPQATAVNDEKPDADTMSEEELAAKLADIAGRKLKEEFTQDPEKMADDQEPVKPRKKKKKAQKRAKDGSKNADTEKTEEGGLSAEQLKLIEEINDLLEEEGFQSPMFSPHDSVRQVKESSSELNTDLLNKITRLLAGFYKSGMKEYDDYVSRMSSIFSPHIVYDANRYFEESWNALVQVMPRSGLKVAIPLRPILEEKHRNGEIDLSKSKVWSLKKGKASTERPAGEGGEEADGPGISGGGRSGRQTGGGQPAGERGVRGHDGERDTDGGGPSAEEEGTDDDVSTKEREDRDEGPERDDRVSSGRDYRAGDIQEVVRATTPTEKLRQNLEALEVLKRISSEGRSTATEDEKKKLVKFMGWGQFYQIFQFSRDQAMNEEWESSRRHVLPESFKPYVKRIAELMTDEEWRLASESTPSAHFTAPDVVIAMWKFMRHLGYRGGRILEPSAGSGWFAALEPTGQQSDWTMVEIDAITARILDLVFPESTVKSMPFEQTRFRPEYFDAAIGNPPFSDRERIKTDPQYRNLKPLLHDYFILKALDYVRPGGVAMFVTSWGTMDKSGTTVRDAIAKKADLLGAFRLPEGAFKKYAGTQVVTDVLIFRKRIPGEDPIDGSQDWIRTVEVEDAAGIKPIMVNEYYANHPEHILGTLGRWGKMYGRPKKELISGKLVDVRPMTVRPTKDNPLDDEFISEFTKFLPQGIMSHLDAEDELIRDVAGIEEGGSLNAVHPGKSKKIILRVGDTDTDVTKTIRKAGRSPLKVWKIVAAYAKLRSAYQDVIESQLRGDPKQERDSARTRLNEYYEAFLDEAGSPLNDPSIEKMLSIDDDYIRIQGIEIKKGSKWVKSEIFEKDTISQKKIVIPDNLEDARTLSLNQYGMLNIPAIAKWLKRGEDDVSREIVERGWGFYDPIGEFVVDAEEYLSGNIGFKLREAREAAEKDDKFKRNVEELQKALPPQKRYYEIQSQLGDGLLTIEELNEFANQITGYQGVAVSIRRSPEDGTYFVSPVEQRFNTSPFNLRIRRMTGMSDTGIGGKHYAFLLKHALQGSYPRLTRDGRVVREWTENAAMIIDEIKAAYERWLWSDPARRARLEERFNLEVSSWKDREFDGGHLTFPGMIQPGTKMERVGRIFEGLRKPQRDVAWRIITRGRAGVFHQVGLGKSIAYIASAMELKRLGKASKIAIVVKKGLVKTIYDHARDLYPNAKVRIVKTSRNKATTAKEVGVIAAKDWDILIFSHENFNNIPVRPETQIEYIEALLDEYRSILAEEGYDIDDDDSLDQAIKSKDISVKNAAKAVRAKRQQLMALLELVRKPGPKAYFEDTGIDYLMVDEAHDFKKVPLVARGLGGVKGMPGSTSKMALNMAMVTDYLHRIHGGRGVVMGTGTPVTNTLVELYVMQKYIQPDILESSGITSFSEWLGKFAAIEEALEPTHAGEIKQVVRIRAFRNINELRRMAMLDFDVKFADDSPDMMARLKLPEKEEIIETIPSSDRLKAYMDYIRQRAENMPSDPREDNHLKLSSDGTMAGVDLRLVIDDPGDQESKLDRAVQNIVNIRKSDPEAVQLIFTQVSESKTTGWNATEYLVKQLVKHGIPENRIANFFGADDKQKAEYEVGLRKGEYWVGIGSTESLGTGRNVQTYLKALHHVEPGWTPESIEQRIGRMVRSGNVYGERGEKVYNYTYLVKSPIDQWRWSLVAKKHAFIQQFMRGETLEDEVQWDDDSDIFSNFEIFEAMSAEDPNRIKKWNAENNVVKHERRYASHREMQRIAEAELPDLNKRLADLESKEGPLVALANTWAERREKEEKKRRKDKSYIDYENEEYDGEVSRDKVLDFIKSTLRRNAHRYEVVDLGTYRGVGISVLPSFSSTSGTVYHLRLTLPGEWKALATVQLTDYYNIHILEWTRINRLISSAIDNASKYGEEAIKNTRAQIQSSKEMISQEYPRLKEFRKWIRDLAKYNEMTGYPREDGMPRYAREIYSKINAAEGDMPVHAPASLFGDLRHDNPQVEERLIKAEGVPETKWIETIGNVAKEALHGLRAQRKIPEGFWFAGIGQFFSRSDKKIPVTEIRRYWANAREWFRLLKEIPAMAAHNAETTLNAILKEIRRNERDYFLFSRIVIMRNLVESIERGEPSRFGFGHDEEGNWLGAAAAHEEALEYLSRLESHIAESPAVQRALDTRERLVDSIVERLVNEGLLPEMARKRARTYYHQQVLTYYEAMRAGRGGPTGQLTKRTFQRKRAEGDTLEETFDYNTHYFEAELAWLYDANYQLMLKSHLDKLAQAYDIMPELRREAKKRNRLAVVGGERMEMVIEEAKWLKRAQRENEIGRDEFIGRANRLAEQFLSGDQFNDKETISAAHGNLTRMLYKIDPQYPYAVRKARALGMLRKEVGHDPILESPKNAGELAKRIKYYIKHGTEEAKTAGLAYFKAMGEETRMIKKRLAENYQTWKSIYRDYKDHFGEKGTFTLWYPKPGNLFFRAYSIPERVYEAILQAEAEGEEGVVPSDKVRSVLAMGGKQGAMMLPTPIVEQLDILKKRTEMQWHYIPKYARKVARAWKLLKILGPAHVVGYSARNFMGDLEPVLAGHIGVLREVKNSVRLLRAMKKSYDDGTPVTGELAEALKYGAINSGFTTEELPAPSQMAKLSQLPVSGPKSAIKAAWRKYWSTVIGFNQFRENVLRLAAFLYFKKHLLDGTLTHYGASTRESVEEVERLFGTGAAAAHLSRNLIGDYGNISPFGEFMRNYVAWFYSWTEVNTRRWPRVIANGWNWGIERGDNPATKLAWGSLGIAMIFQMYLATFLWNLFMFPDEEEELPIQDKAEPHVILGRTNDGNPIVLRRVSALGDFLEWFGATSLLSELPKYKSGQISFTELMQESAKDPVNKVVQGFNPLWKLSVELPTGTSLFPDVFRPRRADRMEQIMGAWDLGDPYRYARGMLLQTGERPRPGTLTGTLYHATGALIGREPYEKPHMVLPSRLIGVSEVGRYAMFETYSLRDAFLRKQGRTVARANPYFRYMRDAAHYGDFTAFQQARARWIEDKRKTPRYKDDPGAIYDSFISSLKRMDPVSGGMSKEMAAEFDQWLTPAQRKKVQVGRDYANSLAMLMHIWWRRAAKNDPPELKKALDPRVQAEIGRKVDVLSKPRPTALTGDQRRSGVKLKDLQKKWQQQIEDAKKWLKDAKIDSDQAFNAYRSYLKQRKFAPKTMRTKLSRAKLMLSS